MRLTRKVSTDKVIKIWTDNLYLKLHERHHLLRIWSYRHLNTGGQNKLDLQIAIKIKLKHFISRLQGNKPMSGITISETEHI